MKGDSPPAPLSFQLAERPRSPETPSSSLQPPSRQLPPERGTPPPPAGLHPCLHVIKGRISRGHMAPPERGGLRQRKQIANTRGPGLCDSDLPYAPGVWR